MKLLFARIGRTFSSVSGEEVKKDSVSDVIDFIKSAKKDTSFLLTAPLEYDIENFTENLNILKLAGFTRLEVNGNVAGIEDLESFGFTPEKGMIINLVIDGFLMKMTKVFFSVWQIPFKWLFTKVVDIVQLKNIETGDKKRFL